MNGPPATNAHVLSFSHRPIDRIDAFVSQLIPAGMAQHVHYCPIKGQSLHSDRQLVIRNIGVSPPNCSPTNRRKPNSYSPGKQEAIELERVRASEEAISSDGRDHSDCERRQHQTAAEHAQGMNRFSLGYARAKTCLAVIGRPLLRMNSRLTACLTRPSRDFEAIRLRCCLIELFGASLLALTLSFLSPTLMFISASVQL
jgi:hypothetical protein